MMINHAVVVTDDGPMGVHSWEEVKDIIFYHFGICKHEFSVTHSSPDPFAAFFNDTHDKDVIFATRRVVDDPIELGFNAWGLDRYGDRELIPFHVKISLDGLSHHAWFREVVEKNLV
jgi:hypothetical protein